MFSTALDFYTGLRISSSRTRILQKFWLWLSIGVNLAFLGIFKYYNFFVASLVSGLAQFGYHPSLWTLNVILPVGISFYTFHGLSYVIDIYNDRIEAAHDFVEYSLFVSFFPLLVAGPIERATHLLPQIKRRRIFEYNQAVSGVRQILWGLFKKIAVADHVADYVDTVFNNSQMYSLKVHFLAAFFFAIEIYCDFSGYSDIAIGTANLFGIRLIRNFSYPYFSRDIAEFWRRWHISLSSWFRDYVYIPLGGSASGKLRSISNVFVIFLVSGIWHGANWTFVVWGLINAIYFLPLMLLGKNRKNLGVVAQGRQLPNRVELSQMLFTMLLAVFAWIFFRAATVKDAIAFITEGFVPREHLHISGPWLLPLIVLFVGEWIGREDQFAIEKVGLKWPRHFRYAMYYSIFLIIVWFAAAPKQFIYFQF